MAGSYQIPLFPSIIRCRVPRNSPELRQTAAERRNSNSREWSAAQLPVAGGKQQKPRSDRAHRAMVMPLRGMGLHDFASGGSAALHPGYSRPAATRHRAERGQSAKGSLFWVVNYESKTPAPFTPPNVHYESCKSIIRDEVTAYPGPPSYGGHGPGPSAG
jgi:hypothetical protein